MKKPSGLELNGVANIQMIIDMLYDDKELSSKAYHDISEQLDTLNRYMTAVSKEIHANHQKGKTYVEVPFWHEVRDNKDQFKTNKGD